MLVLGAARGRSRRVGSLGPSPKQPFQHRPYIQSPPSGKQEINPSPETLHSSLRTLMDTNATTINLFLFISSHNLFESDIYIRAKIVFMMQRKYANADKQK